MAGDLVFTHILKVLASFSISNPATLSGATFYEGHWQLTAYPEKSGFQPGKSSLNYGLGGMALEVRKLETF